MKKSKLQTKQYMLRDQYLWKAIDIGDVDDTIGDTCLSYAK